MKKGFSHEVAPTLITDKPGMTANEVAKLALNRGLCGSDSKTPVQSLAQTLAKEVREGRLSEVVAKKVGGVLRYYPVSDGSSGGSPPRIPPSASSASEGWEIVSVRLDCIKLADVDALVEVDKFRSRLETLGWLVGEGLARNSELVNRAKTALAQIRSIKGSI